MLELTRPEEQALVQRVGLAGDLPVRRSDSLLLVNQNAVANKIDFYLRRRVQYSVHLEPGAARPS